MNVYFFIFQLATFRILLQHWQPFCEWRNNMNSDERAISTLERHKIISKQKESAKRAEMEDLKERVSSMVNWKTELYFCVLN